MDGRDNCCGNICAVVPVSVIMRAMKLVFVKGT